MSLNPHLIRNYKLNKAVNQVLDAFEKEKGKDMKSIFTSKTFWFNFLTGAASIVGIIPLDPHITGLVVGVINVGLRFVTDQPVSLTGK